MNRTKRFVGHLGILLGSMLLGYTSHGQPSVEVGVSVPLPTVVASAPIVEIRTASDFYEPLALEGDWVVIGSYGRCWRPAHVASDWRPYCNGNWQRTDAGWYWASDESWAWATYHYGRWDFSDEYGWYWVPQTQWAPAWVSWQEGDGYVGWVPIQPSGARAIRPQAYVFVEERHFMEPVRSSTVAANNTTIINRTQINQGPATAVIERASGRKIQAVAVQELRQKQEAPVVSRQRTPTVSSEKRIQTPVRSEAGIPATKAAAPPVARPNMKPEVLSHEPAVAAPKNHEIQVGTSKSVPATAHTPEGNTPPVVKEPIRQNANNQPPKQVKQARPADKNPQPPTRDNPAATENKANPADKDPGDKGKE